jgi:hypothetical protein
MIWNRRKSRMSLLSQQCGRQWGSWVQRSQKLYSEHPTMVKTMSGVALSVGLGFWVRAFLQNR